MALELLEVMLTDEAFATLFLACCYVVITVQWHTEQLTWISLSLRPSLSPEYGPSPKVSKK